MEHVAENASVCQGSLQNLRHPAARIRPTENSDIPFICKIDHRTISLSESTKNVKLDANIEDLDSVDEYSDWKMKSKYVQKRPKGWLNRFRKQMGKGGRVEKKEETDRVLHRVKSFRSLKIAAMVGDGSEKRQKRPEKPVMSSLHDLQPYPNRHRQSSLCVVCFHIVNIDCDGLSCQNCPVVAHRSCISNYASLFPDEFGSNKSPCVGSINEPPGHIYNRASSRKPWDCPFCIHEVKLGNKHRQEKYSAAISKHAEKDAILLLQSYVRMFPIKKQYKLLVKAAITVQRFHRSQHLRRALIRERLQQRRPIRLAIHIVTMFYENPLLLPQDFAPLQGHHSKETVASTGSNTRVFCQYSTNYLPKNISNKLLPVVSPDDIAALPIQQQSLKATNTELRRQAMMNLLQLSHMMEPQSATPPLSDPKAAAYPPGTLFLTITVQCFQHGRHVQLYREDMPLLPLQDAALHAKRVEFAAHYEVLAEVNKNVEGSSARKNVGHSLKAMRVYPPRSMVVLPSCPADMTLYFTVSRVTEWPRACIVGQSMFRADHLSIWRQCVCMSQNFTSNDIDEEPKNDSNHRLVIFRAFSTAPHSARGHLDDRSSRPATSHRQQQCASLISRPTTATFNNRHASRSPNKSIEHSPKDIVGGQILWSFISTPPLGNMFGHLHFMATVSQLSYKKKTWCVLIDGQLLMYTRATDIKPKEVIHLKLCYCSFVENDIIKIFRPKDSQSWYCICVQASKQGLWMEAFRENSISQSVRLVSRNNQD